MKNFLMTLAVALMPLAATAQFGVVAPLHVNGNQLNDEHGNKVVLHGVMDTPNPYFNRYRWGNACTDALVPSCINYFDKLFAGISNPAKGTYCNIFRLHLDPCWTNDPAKTSTGSETGEANISRFSSARLQKYLTSLYWPIAQKALGHGLYVVMRPPGVCPKDLKVGDAYQQYLKTVWDIVSRDANIKNNAGVVSLELANEPVHVYAANGTSSARALYDYFQPIVNIIRANGFKGIIWIPGTGYQSQYQSYASYPINDSNYGYAVHVYPGWYGASDTSYDHQSFIKNFKAQVPVVTSKPVLVSEIDWSPEVAGSGKYNEFGQWVASNMGTWGTASTSKWGNAWKAVKDYYGNISMTLTSTDDYLDVDAYLNNGTVQAAFNGNVEACAKACFYWYYEYSKVNYAVASSTGSSSSTTPDTGSNLIGAWPTTDNFVPSGWTVADDGVEVAAGSAQSGPRLMQFAAGGDFTTGFYTREVSATKAGFIEYGGKSGYTLPLVYGEYELTCQVAAWQGTPYLKCEIFDPTGAIVASTIVAAKPDINRSRAAISGATKVNLSFYSMLKGNYKVRFSPVNDAQGNGGTWREVVIGNVGLSYKDNPLAFKSGNQVPAGWTVVDAGNTLAAGAATMGPRTMTFTGGGDFTTGFYVRQSDATKSGYAEYGTAQGYGMSLKAGSYNLSYNAVAWSGTPYLKCEVFDRNNNSLGVQIIRCSKSVNKSLSASTSGSTQGVVNFYAPYTGYYHFRWTPVADQYGNAGTWLEVVFGHIKIQQGTASAKSSNLFGETTAIGSIRATDEKQADVWYNLQGQRVSAPKKGIYIRNGKKVLCP
jgi:roadblock/LC7 domain-containing protein